MKSILLAAILAATPLLASAQDIRVDIGSARIQAGGTTITFGSRDNRGYYWDGYEYRNPDYWKKHNGHKGQKYYTGHPGKGNNGCPPGQGKKGNC